MLAVLHGDGSRADRKDRDLAFKERAEARLPLPRSPSSDVPVRGAQGTPIALRSSAAAAVAIA